MTKHHTSEAHIRNHAVAGSPLLGGLLLFVVNAAYLVAAAVDVVELFARAILSLLDTSPYIYAANESCASCYVQHPTMDERRYYRTPCAL
jgi:hypothetical protein